MGQVIQVNGDYNIKSKVGATIKLDTGAGVGQTVITGDLVVQGANLSVSTTNLEIKDNIIILNSGETGLNTVTLGSAGIVVDRGGDSSHPLEVRRPGLPLVVGGSHLIAAVSFKELKAPEEQASMGSVELVRGAEQEVRVECLHINGVVWRATHRIEDGERSHLMCEAHDLF